MFYEASLPHNCARASVHREPNNSAEGSPASVGNENAYNRGGGGTTVRPSAGRVALTNRRELGVLLAVEGRGVKKTIVGYVYVEGGGGGRVTEEGAEH